MGRPRKHKHIGAARLRELLRYDPDTGIFTWLVERRGRPYGRIPAGTQAGSVWADGYRYLCIDGVTYKSSRLAFLWMTGRNPPKQVDHENLDHGDDRWDNLRLATPKQNQGNKRHSSNNRLGVKGVCYEADRGKYKATIEMNGRSVNLGRFDTAEEASDAYAAAAEKYFGQFARIK